MTQAYDDLVDDLTALADEWESIAAEEGPDESNEWNARCEVWGVAAQKLRETLEDHNQ